MDPELPDIGGVVATYGPAKDPVFITNLSGRCRLYRYPKSETWILYRVATDVLEFESIICASWEGLAEPPL